MNAEELRLSVLELRVADLKAVLSQLSLPITGRKALLQKRIFHYFGESFQGEPPSEPAKEEWKLQNARRFPSLSAVSNGVECLLLSQRQKQAPPFSRPLTKLMSQLQAVRSPDAFLQAEAQSLQQPMAAFLRSI